MALSGLIAQSKLTSLVEAPGVKLTRLNDGRAVAVACRDTDDAFNRLLIAEFLRANGRLKQRPFLRENDLSWLRLLDFATSAELPEPSLSPPIEMALGVDSERVV